MKLYDHQARKVIDLRTHKRWLLAWTMGLGKTIALLSVCAERPMKTLVLCPRSVMRAAWLRDAEHFPGLKVRCLWHPSKAARLRMIREDWDIGVINYESFKTNIKELAAVGVRRLICDESSKIKNFDSATAKYVIAFADRVEECYLLSGTPAPNNGTEYWPQVRCVDPAWAGKSFWAWANRYFVPIRKRFNGREVIAGWRPNSLTEAEFKAGLARCCDSLKKEDCLDLPPKIDTLREVELVGEAAAYRSAEEELRILESPVKIEAQLIKLRQIVGGSVLIQGNPVDLGRSKLDALLEVLEEAGPQPAVIWCEFSHEIDRVAAELAALGPVGTIDGRTSHRAGETAAAFQDGSLRYLVCHPAAAGHGITLTAASLAVYFSLSFSAELYAQSRDRIHRVGQSRTCQYVHLMGIVEGEETVDYPMLRVLRGKVARGAAILEAVSGRQGGAVVAGR